MSAIEWTDVTWNPVTGCSKVSPGCDHCYAETLSLRFGWSKLPWTHENAAANVVLHPERLRKPLSWRKPRMVFVNSMSDMFHENVPLEFLAEVWDVMVRTPQHTYQILTKRPQRIAEALGPKGIGFYAVEGPVPCPQPNIWLGTSIESWRFNYRADQLRRAPAKVRFISAEPLLGSLCRPATPSRGVPSDGSGVTAPASVGDVEAGDSSPLAASADGPSSVQVGPRASRALNLTDIDWVIVGGESGPGARPMHPDWAREIRDACLTHWAAWIGRVAHLPPRPAFFFKQWGEWAPETRDPAYAYVQQVPARKLIDLGTAQMALVGKKHAGRLLDGREWNEMPS